MTDMHIQVAGHTPTHLLVYPLPSQGENDRRPQRFGLQRCHGGAALIADLLDASAHEHGHKVHGPPLEVSDDRSLEQPASAITELEIFGELDNQLSSYKVKHSRPLDTKPRWCRPQVLLKTTEKVRVLILQDAESDFRNKNDAVDFFRESRPETLIYHMACPLGIGSIWDAVRRGPYTRGGAQDPEKLIVVVSADDLRAEGIELYHGLSWEKTCEDFVEKLGSKGQLDTLATCANLLVLFGCDGVIYHRGRQMEEPTLFFDPLGVEGRFNRRHIGPVPGVVEAFIGGLATEIAQSPPGASLNAAISFGFITARRLARLGFRTSQGSRWPRYPHMDIIKKTTLPDEAPITLEIPSESISRGEKRHWSILHHNIGDPVQVACHIVTQGTYSAANWVPIASFGRLLVLDRWETEGFRNIFNAIYEYLSAPQIKPLNIGIFGSRGSGKSFATVQVAESAASAARSDIKIQHLRFDLSQFTTPEDLSLAFNKVRECNLSGTLPLLYINAFDAELSGRPLGWLAHLLPPMHGGRVQDRGEMHHIGPAIILLGSSFTTSLENFEDFSKNNSEDGKVLLRAQEFLSCLHAFVNVIGIDQIDSSDVLYPVRRAVVLRALLEEREPKLKMGEGISIDQSILDGLLLIPTYRHGLRSLKSIIALSKVTGKRHFERAALPPEAQLGLHLDYPTFLECSRYNTLSDDLRESISEKLHNVYVQIRRRMAMTAEEKQALESDLSLAPWESLNEELKESTRSHAVDIPRKLRSISCFLAAVNASRKAVDSFGEKELDILAEQEHERWNAERLQNQWHQGKRDPGQRTSPFLIPWRDLDQKWQNVDREMVRSYPTILPEGYKIYRIGKVEKTKLIESTTGLKRAAITW
ncbi:uncharacterized protein Z520_04148 [Fonsecaea multimorphosa CBS 102226]|uniref:Ryanodine receptor Ryr domain-containing protein n=1 Tax=Fonsecaea multimorphosa CBS 102226 TaxID=1442371 RepID=A0A0D2K3T9_9EURO|nr:uncharacterized protein Z520_04148 [Fonsecaea multimorphosa CBS 102226]KIY00463.1 hypothetical protein Z520_04148 [Fonsecaea multimorphosa CBS 102226]OAL26977.1 hypothetical protein AYO22_03921 [Fonsecaea multimorphosa]